MTYTVIEISYNRAIRVYNSFYCLFNSLATEWSNSNIFEYILANCNLRVPFFNETEDLPQQPQDEIGAHSYFVMTDLAVYAWTVNNSMCIYETISISIERRSIR